MLVNWLTPWSSWSYGLSLRGLKSEENSRTLCLPTDPNPQSFRCKFEEKENHDK